MGHTISPRPSVHCKSPRFFETQPSVFWLHFFSLSPPKPEATMTLPVYHVYLSVRKPLAYGSFELVPAAKNTSYTIITHDTYYTHIGDIHTLLHICTFETMKLAQLCYTCIERDKERNTQIKTIFIYKYVNMHIHIYICITDILQNISNIIKTDKLVVKISTYCKMFQLWHNTNIKIYVIIYIYIYIYVYI